MKEIRIVAINTAELLDAEIKRPKAGEVLVRMQFSAVSAGTERDVISGKVAMSFAKREHRDGYTPQITQPIFAGGYSGSAIVEEVGAGVTGYQKGDRVVVHGGNHSQYATVAEKELCPVPEHVPMDEAAFAIISGFSLAAVRKADLELGESCAVVGLGLLGLYSVQFARLSGAYPIIAVDFDEERRNLALKLGADYAIDPSDAAYKEKILSYTNGKGADAVIEVTGNGAALNQILPCTAKFGRVILLGCTRMPTELSLYFDVHCPGIQLIGAHSGARPKLESHHGAWTEMDDCAAILRYLSANRLNFAAMISETHCPADAPEVYARLAHDKKFPIGVVFDWTKLEG